MYNFQGDSNAVPVFYINKNTWTEGYKRVIHQCLLDRMCYILVEPDPNVSIRMVEFTCMCRADFEKNYENIEKILDINPYNKYKHKKTGNPYSLITNNFMFKDLNKNGELEWRRGLCLYKTEYNNPDGEYFARTRDDFYKSFDKID